MSKKYQVIIPNWMADYIEIVSESYEMTISEVLRLEISIGILTSTQHLCHGYKPKVLLADLLKHPRETKPKDVDREQFHRDLSKILFESRKAVEYRMEKLKKLQEEQER